MNLRRSAIAGVESGVITASSSRGSRLYQTTENCLGISDSSCLSACHASLVAACFFCCDCIRYMGLLACFKYTIFIRFRDLVVQIVFQWNCIYPSSTLSLSVRPRFCTGQHQAATMNAGSTTVPESPSCKIWRSETNVTIPSADILTFAFENLGQYDENKAVSASRYGPWSCPVTRIP